MTETPTIQELAGEAARWFETARRATGDTDTGPREDGELYVRTKEGAPEWVRELVWHAHGDMLPDDYRYRWTSDALDAIAEWMAGWEEDPSDSDADFDDGAVDVYTAGRLAWLGSNLNRTSYVDEARDELGPFPGVVEEIGAGMYLEAREVFALVVDALRSELERRDEEA